ncbi:MAG TPA: hypothetical protein VJ924_05770 [Alphaproteobacteria bacterium]|nr:hypothetical protein [Alphaproteobacteria bacterium]
MTTLSKPRPIDAPPRRAAALAFAALVAMLLAACNTPEPRARFAEMTFEHRGDLRLDVAAVDIDTEYRAPLAAPHVEHLFPVAPEAAMRRWARDRLAATGAPGRRARFIVKDARVIEEKLARTQGIRGAFTRDQTERYTITLEAALQIVGARGVTSEGFAVARATRSRTVAESVTVNQRERAWFELLEEAMRDLDSEFERQIQSNLAQYLR